ncbi:probable ubiquitin-conjugating enzyme E2 23 [Musa acuminata AAA Group]|uniref:probable ubiquitin-conjugating enzyme E2 23 n=1 Tax=Musa acuminata AAA Group TaxID=214697 RepID=UPI0031DBB501
MESGHHLAHESLAGYTTMKVNNVPHAIDSEQNASCSDAESRSDVGKPVKTGELTDTQAADVFVYRQDVVKCSKCKGLHGIVLETAGDSDPEGSISGYDSSEEDEDNNDEGNGDDNGDVNSNIIDGGSNDFLQDGQVRLLWCDGSETVENTNDVTVVDRSFLRGDIVASATDPTGQLGVIINVNMTVDLLSTDGMVIENVSSRALKHIREFSVGDFVVLGPWLGKVDEVFDNVTVLFDDGYICEVVKPDPLQLRPLIMPVVSDTDCPYYPGQRVRAISSSVFEGSSRKAKLLKGTVIKVQTDSVVVYWIASAVHGVGDNSATFPSKEQNPKNLTLLSCSSHINWQLADWCLLPSYPHTNDLPKNCSCSTSYSVSKKPANGSWPSYRRKPWKFFFRGDKKIWRRDGNFERALLIVKAFNKVDVAWQDGTTEFGLQSTSLIPFDTPNDHEFFPGEFVVEKAQNEGGSSSETNRLGVLRSANSQEQTVCVRWLKPASRPGDLKEFNGEEVVSAYELERHADYDYFYGDVVVRLPPVSDDIPNSEVPTETQGNQLDTQKTADDSSKEYVEISEENRALDNEACEDFTSLSWVGNIVGLQDGDIEVSWADGMVSKVPPQEVYIVYRHNGNGDNEDEDEDEDEDEGEGEGEGEGEDEDEDEGEGEGEGEDECEGEFEDGDEGEGEDEDEYDDNDEEEDEDNDDDDDDIGVSDDDASWETASENEMDVLEGTEKEVDPQNPSDSNLQGEHSATILEKESSGGQSRPLTLPLAAIDYAVKHTTGLFSRAKKQLESSGLDKQKANDANHKADLDFSGSKLDGEDENKGFDVSDGLIAERIHENIETDNHMEATEKAEVKIEDNLEKPASMGLHDGSEGSHIMDDPCKFKHFDTAENPLDHHFLAVAEMGTGGRKWGKKVQREWSILEKNLPDDIYVRVFEDRMDLIRAVIVGAYGTPYQDGLFFFDFHLSSEYPQVPPSVYYHSGGLRMNPNLYVDGKICLSLLNTWTGKGSEVWDPSFSSVLQVLVSLQGLVLNDKPYFNEAGYEKHIGTVEGEKNASPYNENAYLTNLKSMLYLLRRPPTHFEDFVKDHFRRRGHYILKACEAYYTRGCLIGSLTKDGCLTEESQENSCSVGFNLTLAKILPHLIPALNEVGADCRQFEYLLTSGTLNSPRS